MKAALALLCLAVCALGQTWYKCDLDAADWVNANTCLKLDDSSTSDYNVIDIRPCVSPFGSVCPATTNIGENDEIACTASTALPVLTAGSVVPGMPCTSDVVCVSGICSMGYCVGVGSGESCATNGDEDCNPGLYCDTTQTTPVCTALLGLGNYCTGDNQCAMNLGCNNNVCTAFYSLDASEIDSHCGNVGTDYNGFPLPVGSAPNYSVYCKSGTCTENQGGTGGSCTFALHSSTSVPVSCTVGTADQCPTNNGSTGENPTITTNTVCGPTSLNPTGQTYCALEIGDANFLTFIQWVTGTWAPLFNGATQYCHTSLRGINNECLRRMGGEYLLNEYTVVLQNAVNFPLHQDTDVCTLQVFLPEYFASQQYNYFCDTVFQCLGNSTTAFANNVGCIQQTPYSTFNIRPCTDPINTVCPTVQIYQATKEVECVPGPSAPGAATGLLPGDICSSNYQCLSNLCTNGMCVGVGNTGLCPNGDSDCNPGLYCIPATGTSDAICGPLLATGSTTTHCTSSSQCAMNAGCNFDPTTGLGVCVEYYSVGTGQSVSDCGMGSFIAGMKSASFPQGSSYYVQYSALCNSGTCAFTSGTLAGSYAGTCVAAYHSQGALPQTCNFGPTDCPMTNADNAITYGQCKCAMTNTPKTRYCSIDFGDQPWVDFISWRQTYFTNFTTYYSTSCHTYRRAFDPLCMQKIGGTPRMMQFQEIWSLANNYATIINADNCTQQVYNSAYRTAHLYNTPYTPDEISAAGWLGLALFLAY